MKKRASSFKEALIQVMMTEIPANFVAAGLVAWIGSFLGIPPLTLTIIVLFFLLPNNPFNLSKSTISETIEVKEIKQEREKIIERIEREDSVVDIIRLNLNQITEYYTINKNQARRSFSFSALVIFLGFITVVMAILLPFIREGQKLELSIISGVSGLILQFIGGANFVLYNRTVEQSNRFYKQLTRIQDTMLAVELCKQVKDPEKNLQLMDKLITNLIERSSAGIESDFLVNHNKQVKNSLRESKSSNPKISNE